MSTEAADFLELASGDSVQGRWRSGVLTLRTPYADLEFSRDRVSDLKREPSTRLVRITTGTGQGFTGFLQPGEIEFQWSMGPVIQVKAGTIRGLRVDEERALSTNGLFMVLHNGDVLTGDVSPRRLHVRDQDGDEKHIPFDELQFIGFPGPERARLNAIDREDRTVSGTLMSEYYTVDLDGGPSIRVPVTDMDILTCQEGFRPAPSAPRSPGISPTSSADTPISLFIRSTSSVNTGLGLRFSNGLATVEEVDAEDIFHGILQPGDILAAVDGSPYRPTLLTRKTYNMLNGGASMVRLNIQRENSSFVIHLRQKPFSG